MKRRLGWALVLALLVSGCATTTTLRHPVSQEVKTCEPGVWVGFGIIGIAAMTVGNIVEGAVNQSCINEATEAGYERVSE